jgi:hypothetical protein
LPPVAPPLRRWQSSAHCAVHPTAAIPSPITIPSPLPPIAPPLPIAADAVHRDLTAAVHCDRRCHPSRVASNCAASALAAIVRCTLYSPSRRHRPMPIAIPSLSRRPLRGRCLSPLPPSTVISPPLSIVIAAAVHLALPPIAPLLHWRQLSAALCAIHCNAAVPLPIAIDLPSRRPLRGRCPSPLPPSIAISPLPCIMIAAAVHLALPPIDWQRLSAAHCAIHCAAAVPSPIVINSPFRRPLRCRCPSPLPSSIAISLPLSIVIATAVHLESSPIAPLLHLH